jgi:hypothetical protein
MPSSTSGPGSSEPHGAADRERLPAPLAETAYGRGLPVLWVLMLAGPVLWWIDLQLAYLLVYRACHSRNLVPLYVETAVILVLVAASGAASLWWMRKFGEASRHGGQPDDRARFMTIAGAGLSALFFLVLAAAAIPRFTLDPCP